MKMRKCLGMGAPAVPANGCDFELASGKPKSSCSRIFDLTQTAHMVLILKRDPTGMKGLLRKAHLIMRRVERLSRYCRSLLRSTYIQSRTETVPYAACRSEEPRPAEALWRRSLHETRLSCVEKLASVRRNSYSNTKMR